MPELIDEAQFSVPTDATRTVIGDDGRSVYWEVGDRLALWAKNSSGEYVASGAQFMLRHFSTSYTKAFFAGTIAEQSDDAYTYYMCAPMPKTVSGTDVTYTLPAEQSGKYQSSYDIMVARALEAGAITTSKSVEFNTSFIHQMHALKITVPEGKNTFGHEFNRLEIIFPQPVVGDITFDVSDPEAEPIYTNTSNTITVYNPDGLRVGEEFWVFVLPGTVSGNIKYRVVASDCRSHYNEVSSITNKRLLRGHVTPIRMTTPELEPYMIINFSIGGNNLGEKVDKVTVLAPNGSELGSFVCNNEATDIFTLRYDTINNDIKNCQNNNFTIRYESAHAIVENTLYVGTLNEYAVNNMTPMVVPYLLYEDFSTFPAVSNNDNYTGGSNATKTGAVELKSGSGWHGARCGVQAGTSARIASRRETSASYAARIDAPQLTGIKSGATVNVRVTYDYGANQEKGGLSSKYNGFTVWQGYTTQTGGIASPSSGASPSGTYDDANKFHIEADERDGSYTNLPHKNHSFTLSGVGNNVRVSWATVSDYNGSLNNNTQWLYIDNVRVQIIP